MRQVPLERDINIAINSGFATSLLRATRAVPAFYTLLLLDQLAQSSIPDLLSSVLFSQNGLTERSGCREQQKGVICRDAPHFSVWHASVCLLLLGPFAT